MQSLYSNGAFRVALQIIPVFETVNKQESVSKNNIERLLEIKESCCNLLDPRPNWTAIWKLHEKLFRPHEFSNTRECYPGVLFIARVLEISKSK